MKNVVKLDNYYSPKDLEEAIDQVIDYYNNCRVHEALGNITPADVYFGRAEQILQERQQIKLQTIRERQKNYKKDKCKMIEKQIWTIFAQTTPYLKTQTAALWFEDVQF